MKNKRGGIELIIYTIIILFITTTIILITAAVISQDIRIKELDKACEEIGYAKYEYKMPYEFCEDKEGNLYYIKSECEYVFQFLELFAEECTAKKISIGEVEVKQ